MDEMMFKQVGIVRNYIVGGLPHDVQGRHTARIALERISAHLEVEHDRLERAEFLADVRADED